ncbi:MAG: Chromosome partition protein Smc [Wolbachia endosymbiont of Ctenocephalides orientis wCori]|nr:MAG: Chromosome partition protein Smc [Wolbachia endosymbiont of Ctenocephalides orientis wCori]
MLVDVAKKSASLVKKYLKNESERKSKVSIKIEEVNIVADVTSVIDNLISAYESYSPRSNNKEKLKNYINKLSSFISIKDKIAKHSFSTKDSAIEKFCRLIAENEDLQKELDSLSVQSKKDGSKELYSQLGKIVNKFNIFQLQKKLLFLQKLKDKDNFDTLRKDYQDEWKFYSLLEDLTNDKEFKQAYIDKVIEEKDKLSCSDLKEGIGTYLKSMQQGKFAASKYFEEGTELQAYYTEVNSENRILNINLNGNKNGPTKISDILKQEKDTSELNIYFKKKREIHVSQDKDEKRYYKFEKGASYEMTSVWPVKDKNGKISSCTMVMHVSDEGITDILDFDDGAESQLQYEERMELIKQNHELYIQSFSLHDSVKKFRGLLCEERLKVIEKDKEQPSTKLPDVVLKASESLQYDKAVNAVQITNKGVSGIELKKSLNIPQNQSNNLRNLTNDKTIAPITLTNEVAQQNSSAPNVNFNNFITNKVKLSASGNSGQQSLTQPKVPFQKQALPQQPTVRVAAVLKHTETQTEVELLRESSSAQAEVCSKEASTQGKGNLQDASAQTEVSAQYINDLRLKNKELKKENVESKQLSDSLMKTSHQLGEELKEAKIENKKWRTEAKSLAKTLSERNQQNENFEHINRQLNNEVEELKDVKKGLEDELKKNKQALENLTNMLSESDQQNNKIKCANEKFKETIEQLEDEVGELKDELEKNAQELEDRDNAYKLLVKINSDRAKETFLLKEESERFKEQLRRSNIENEGLKNKLNTLQAELNQTQEEAEQIIINKGEIIQSLRRDMSELEEKHKERQEDSQCKMRELTWKLAEKESELNLKKVKVGKLINQIKNLELKIHKLVYEQESQNRKIAELKDDIEGHDADIKLRDREIEEQGELFRKEMESKKEKFQSAERMYRELEARYQELEMRYEQVKQFKEEMEKYEQLIGPLKSIIIGPNKSSIADAYIELVEKKDREIKVLENRIRELIEIMEDTAQKADRTVYELERSKEEMEYLNNTIEDLRDQVQDLADKDSKQRTNRLSDLQNAKLFYTLTGDTLIGAIADIRNHISPHKQRSSVSDSDYISSDNEEEVYVTPPISIHPSPLSSPKAHRPSSKQENSTFHADKERARRSNSSSPLPDVLNR